MAIEGDHIKVTASKYPFPTVCADKQSTDWFHAISRTLKWNERERQKSFVVVEEEPAKHRKKKSKRSESATTAKTSSQISADQTPDDEEEDEVSDEEDDKFDIDDSSAEADHATEQAAIQKVESNGKTLPLRPSFKRKSKSRSRSRPPGSAYASGVESPNRFVTEQPHPPDVSPRHVGFNLPSSRSSASSSAASTAASSPESAAFAEEGHEAAREEGAPAIHKHTRLLKDRDYDGELAKTPTPSSLVYGRGRGHSRTRSSDVPERRAFAVWGHDESDSNASDSES